MRQILRYHLYTFFFSATCLLILSSCVQEKKHVGQRQLKAPVLISEMQDFIVAFSDKAKGQKKGFLIIPQNGSFLAFDQGDRYAKINSRFLNSIDAFGIEGLYYNGSFEPDTVRVNILRELNADKKILVSEYVEKDKNITDARQKIDSEGFVGFIRNRDNFDYKLIPRHISNENNKDITKIEQVRNYLYLINPSNYGSKTDFIAAVTATNYDLVIMDLFFNNNEPFTPSELAALKVKENGGKRLVVSYINIGAAEEWRYYWKEGWKLHSPVFLESRYDGYDNEYWVQYWNPKWQEIIYGAKDSYLSKIINAGFDGAYLDNVEAYKYIYGS